MTAERKKSVSRLVPLLLLSMLLGACQSSELEGPEGSDRELEVQCESPRPQLCSEDYRPVCARRDTGVRCVTTPCPASEWRDYSNACHACSDPAVMSYRDGSCTVVRP